MSHDQPTTAELKAEFKRRFNLGDQVLQSPHNGGWKGRGNAICPFHSHKDHSRSLSVNLTKGIWRCFNGTCNKAGDVFDWMGFMEFGDNWNHKDQGMFWGLIKRLLNIPESELPKHRELPAQPPELKEIKYSNPTLWASQLWDDPAQAGLVDWLGARGINEEWGRYHELGYTGNDPLLQRWERRRLAIIWRVNFEVVAVKLRIDPRFPANGKMIKYLSIGGSEFENHVFNQDCLMANHHIRDRYVWESELDAIAVNCYLGEDICTSVPASTFNSALALLFLGKRLIYGEDGDSAGKAQSARVKQFRRDCVVLSATPGTKDPGECFQKGLPPPVLKRLESKPFQPLKMRG